jgi:hypothetical protein
MLGGHADQEVGIGTDAAVGQVVVGEDDQDVRTRCLQLLHQGIATVAHHLLHLGRGTREQPDQGRCVGDTRCVDKLGHTISSRLIRGAATTA